MAASSGVMAGLISAAAINRRPDLSNAVGMSLEITRSSEAEIRPEGGSNHGQAHVRYEANSSCYGGVRKSSFQRGLRRADCVRHEISTALTKNLSWALNPGLRRAIQLACGLAAATNIFGDGFVDALRIERKSFENCLQPASVGVQFVNFPGNGLTAQIPDQFSQALAG